MDKKLNPPIEPGNFLGGVKVVDIGDLRVSRGLTRRHSSVCKHLDLVYDERERRIWCKDCDQEIDPFDAFVGLVEHFHYAYKQLKDRRKELDEAERFQIRSLAAKNIDKVWRCRSTIPACPYCGAGLFPEDFKKHINIIGREFAEKQRK